ncbi:Hypothetical protein FKW44_016721, partial [Caligus rogercresseyi]
PSNAPPPLPPDYDSLESSNSAPVATATAAGGGDNSNEDWGNQQAWGMPPALKRLGKETRIIKQ